MEPRLLDVSLSHNRGSVVGAPDSDDVNSGLCVNTAYATLESESKPLRADSNHSYLTVDDPDEVKTNYLEVKHGTPSINSSTTLPTTTVVNSRGQPLLFDDLEYLREFLERDSKRPWFESNCFKCNVVNIIKLFVAIVFIVGIVAIIVWQVGPHFFNKHWLHITKLASIPIICILFTYGHIALALWMTFYPTQFFGIFQFKSGPFEGYGLGWQGIVPMKAVRMAQVSVDLMVPHVVRIEDIVERIDPAKVAEIMEPACLEVLKIIIPRVAAEQSPAAWALLPEAMKQKMISVAVADAPITVANMIEDINSNIAEVFDLKDMVSTALQNDRELLSNVFMKCGRKELIFIRNFGAVLGLVLGLIQMIATMTFKGNWYFDHLMLPISGFALGWITNWVALALIFRPVHPVRIKLFGCFGPVITIHGLFLKRQREVSVEFAAFITQTVMRAELIFFYMLSGKSADQLFELVTKHLREACDRFAGFDKFKPLIEFAIGTERYELVKKQVCGQLLRSHELECADKLKEVQSKIVEYADEVMDLERTLRTKMSELSSEQFEQALHPVFEEDEIKLIVIGAVLGLMVGLFQVYVIKN